MVGRDGGHDEVGSVSLSFLSPFLVLCFLFLNAHPRPSTLLSVPPAPPLLPPLPSDSPSPSHPPSLPSSSPPRLTPPLLLDGTAPASSASCSSRTTESLCLSSETCGSWTTRRVSSLCEGGGRGNGGLRGRSTWRWHDDLRVVLQRRIGVLERETRWEVKAKLS